MHHLSKRKEKLWASKFALAYECVERAGGTHENVANRSNVAKKPFSAGLSSQDAENVTL